MVNGHTKVRGVEDCPNRRQKQEDIVVCEERLCLLKGLPDDRSRESHQGLLQSRKHRMTK